MRITLEYKSKESRTAHVKYFRTMIPNISGGMTIEALLTNLEVSEGGLSIKTMDGFSDEILASGPMQHGAYYFLRLPSIRINLDRYMRGRFPSRTGAVTEEVQKD